MIIKSPHKFCLQSSIHVLYEIIKMTELLKKALYVLVLFLMLELLGQSSVSHTRVSSVESFATVIFYYKRFNNT